MASNQRKEKHILFYSKECQHSMKIIKLIQEYPDLNVIFKKLSIEDILQQGGRLPPDLQAVPGVVVDGQHLIQAHQAFQWLENEVKNFLVGQGINAADDLGFSFLDGSSSGSNSNNFSSIDSSNNTFTDKVQMQGQQFSSGSTSSDLARLQQERNQGINIQRGPGPQQDNFNAGSGNMSMDFSRMQQERNQGINIQRGPGPQGMNMRDINQFKQNEMDARMQQMQQERSMFGAPPRQGGAPPKIDFSLPM